MPITGGSSKTFFDGIDVDLNQMQTDINLIKGYVDTVESVVGTVKTQTDSVEGTLSTINGKITSAPTLIVASNTVVYTQATSNYSTDDIDADYPEIGKKINSFRVGNVSGCVRIKATLHSANSSGGCILDVFSAGNRYRRSTSGQEYKTVEIDIPVQPYDVIMLYLGSNSTYSAYCEDVQLCYSSNSTIGNI